MELEKWERIELLWEDLKGVMMMMMMYYVLALGAFE
jgi:hypothetical protein